MASSGISWTPRARRLGRLLAAIGIVLVLALVWSTCNHGTAPSASGSHSPGGTGSPTGGPSVMPPATLVWMSGTLPPGFGTQLASLPHVDHQVVVEGGTAWLTRSAASDGTVVDSPALPYGVPLEVFAADPGAYAPFLPPALKNDFRKTLRSGQGILGQSSATLRKIGAGGTLRFGTKNVTVGMVVPDAVVGASELFVSRKTATRLGLTEDRFALLQLSRPATDANLEKKIQPFLPAGEALVVKAPGESAYLRTDGDGVPPIFMKIRFGEFDGHPDQATPGSITIDPAWVATNIQTRTVPILGKVQCNAAIFTQLIGALSEIETKGLASTVHSTSGCYAARTISADNSALSPHAWGAAVDINPAENVTGSAPSQNPRMVRIFENWGFRWGGDFPVPDGMHFEYLKPAQQG